MNEYTLETAQIRGACVGVTEKPASNRHQGLGFFCHCRWLQMQSDEYVEPPTSLGIFLVVCISFSQFFPPLHRATHFGCIYNTKLLEALEEVGNGLL